jgi:hypothetical protein
VLLGDRDDDDVVVAAADDGSWWFVLLLLLLVPVLTAAAGNGVGTADCEGWSTAYEGGSDVVVVVSLSRGRSNVAMVSNDVGTRRIAQVR